MGEKSLISSKCKNRNSFSDYLENFDMFGVPIMVNLNGKTKV